jgi:hypothetical protein
MSTTNEFDTLKRKIYFAYHQDGILDITAATVLLGFGTFMATDNVIFLILGAIFAAQYVMMKQRITIPRFGYVRLEPREKTLTKLSLLAGLGVLVLLVFIGLSTLLGNVPSSLDMQAWMRRYHMILYSGVLFGLPALAAAVFLGLNRFYLYALLTVGLPALGAWLNIETFIPILATGFVLLAYGIVLLSSFLKKYSINDNESSSVNG